MKNLDREPLKDETVYVLACGNWIAHVFTGGRWRSQVHFFAERPQAIAACRAFNRNPNRAALHVRKLQLHSLGFKKAKEA